MITRIHMLGRCKGFYNMSFLLTMEMHFFRCGDVFLFYIEYPANSMLYVKNNIDRIQSESFAKLWRTKSSFVCGFSELFKDNTIYFYESLE